MITDKEILEAITNCIRGNQTTAFGTSRTDWADIVLGLNRFDIALLTIDGTPIPKLVHRYIMEDLVLLARDKITDASRDDLIDWGILQGDEHD